MTQPADANTDQTPPPPTPPRPRRWRRFARGCGRFAFWAGVMLMTAWAALAIRFADLSGAPPRSISSFLFIAAILAAVIFIRPRRYRLGTLAILLVGVLCWYFSIRARNDRDWTPDNARIATIEIDGDRVVVHNVRDFDWRTTEDFTPRWRDDTYRLSDLRSVDLLFSHWGSKALAHGMVSFGFADGRFLCASIETRREQAEQQDALQSFFRQYELIYIFADERDFVRVRTNARKENVYLYRTRVTREQAQALFLSYAKRANALADDPEFYNALTSNCITNVVHMSRVINPKARVTWRILLSGYAPQGIYANGRLDNSMPFEELEKRSLIDAAAQAANNDPEFSKAIRAGLPVPAQPDR